MLKGAGSALQMKTRAARAAGCALFLLLAASSCRAADARPNVILISLNALRADHLGTYGYARETAPNIALLARGSAVFDRAVSQSHWTLSSLASLFTSKYVRSHGLYDRGGRLSKKETTLAEALKAGGYKTAAFTGGLDTSGFYGLNQGFELYDDETGSRPMGSFREIMPKALNWLAAHRGDRFFLFLDSYDIHPPFDKPWPAGVASSYAGLLKGKTLDYGLFRDYKDGELPVGGGKVRLGREDLDYVNARYDNGITYADGFLGALFKKLRALGLADGTVIILTAEHGEELGEHGSFDRFGSGDLHDEAVRVPLIVKLPGKDLKGARVRAQVQLIDIMPTILDLAGLRPGPGAQGKSLRPLLEAPAAELDRYVYSEAGPRKCAVGTGKWKLIYDKGDYSLFDLAADKAEAVNAAAKNPDVVYELAQKLAAWRRETGPAGGRGAQRVALTEEMKRKLKEAGYWTSDGPRP